MPTVPKTPMTVPTEPLPEVDPTYIAMAAAELYQQEDKSMQAAEPEPKDHAA